jgi:hypothetical protein
MNRIQFQKILFLFLKKDYPFIINCFPYSVEYDGITLKLQLGLLVKEDFLKKHLSTYCLNDEDVCANDFTIGVTEFDVCSDTFNFDIVKLRKRVSECYLFFTGDIPYLVEINAYLTSDCG